MANFSVNDLDGLMMDLKEIAELPDTVAEGMLDAEAKIVESAQVFTGMKMGVHRTGVTLTSITHGRMKKGKDGGKVKYVYPQGTNAQGERNATVAFVNEFGAPRRGIPARPFIKLANEDAADAAVDAAAEVYDKYLKSKNL
nr:MAG TPA: virion morphogenesis protein [Caudoviricetes sp.]